MTGFHGYHSNGFPCRRNTKILTGSCYQTTGNHYSLMPTFIEGTLLSLHAILFAFLLSWTGGKRGGTQIIGNTVRPFVHVATRMNGDGNS
jgi:hypothetical protein